MRKTLIALALCSVCISFVKPVNAQTSKNRKSRYYQQNMKEPDDFNVQGFARDVEKKEVDGKPKEDEYDVRVKSRETDSKYYDEKRVIVKEKNNSDEDNTDNQEAPRRRRKSQGDGYYTSYGTYVPYNDNRANYDKYYTSGSAPAPRTVMVENNVPPPPPPPPAKRMTKRVIRKTLPDDREIKMTSAENEYKTTYVKKRYTNLDVLCDDLDLAKIQRPVFKGICQECSRDVDLIITNKNLSSLEKNYQLKQCYMLRDKRIRETLEEDQYRKFLRIKDADEYLVITKDLEQKDGVHK